jgi:hypothetical protein
VNYPLFVLLINQKLLIMKKLLFVALAALVLSSCTNIYKTMREPNSRVEFEPGDFQFSQQVKATAQTTRILMIDWTNLFSKNVDEGTISKDGVFSLPISAADIPVIGSIALDKTANYALYKLMEENPGYDVVFYPQYTTTVSRPILGLGGLKTVTTVEVTARLAKIK